VAGTTSASIWQGSAIHVLSPTRIGRWPSRGRLRTKPCFMTLSVTRALVFPGKTRTSIHRPGCLAARSAAARYSSPRRFATAVHCRASPGCRAVAGPCTDPAPPVNGGLGRAQTGHATGRESLCLQAFTGYSGPRRALAAAPRREPSHGGNTGSNPVGGIPESPANRGVFSS
jgi:hypothetical protein